MASIGRLNSIIRAWEEGRPAFASFANANRQTAIEFSTSPYDAVVFEMEHNPWDVEGLQDSMQYLLNRKQIVTSGSLAPTLTPIVRIPSNGVEMNQSFAKQALDRGVYGVIWPHIGNAEQAYNAVASCRYARKSTADFYEPAGVRGDGPATASRYWGLTLPEYYRKADVWPLNPEGEILVITMIESLSGVKNLDDILKTVQGIGCVLIGEGDLSQALGYPRQYEHPEVRDAMKYIVETCRKYDVPVGHPHVTTSNVEKVVADGYRFLMSAPVRTFEAIQKAKALTGKTSADVGVEQPEQGAH
jgi:4-hydroxy-2-oxoheptanedioate aldolase